MNDHITDTSVSKANPFSVMLNVITEPGVAFKEIKAHQSWVFPVILSIISMILVAYLTFDIQLEFQTDLMMQSEKLPESVKDQQLEKLENQTSVDRYVWPAVSATVLDLVFFLGATLALWVLGNFIFGGQLKFSAVFTMVSWAGIIGIIELIVKGLIMYTKGSIHAYTSLALFMDPMLFKEWSFQLANLVDIFVIWKFVVYVIAFSAFYQLEKEKVAIGIGVLFILNGLLKAGWIVFSLSLL